MRVFNECKDCLHYDSPETTGCSMGKCAYPLPGWLLISCSGAGFVHGYEGVDCALYKNKRKARKDTINNEANAAD